MFLMVFGSGDPFKQNVLEFFFFMDMVLTFFVEWIPEQEGLPKIRTHKGIALRYLKDNFFIEVLPLVPLHIINIEGFGNLLYFIKLIRLSRGFELINVHKLMKHIKNFYKDYTLKIVL